MTDHIVAPADELEEGGRIITELNGREICVFNIDGEYYAYNNWCAHQAGPICEGNITGTTEASFDPESLEVSLDYCREGEILNCPWHGWEYEVKSGKCLSRQKVQLPSYAVRVEGEDIIVTL
ncbi:Rieske (2Fe-2S) protein [Halalkalicoccus jeotgali]|uniref:Rieske (2Fe-2S) iron-sulfur domain protein n=1 Tax=Halalkalicoccus jeotgali (strain DSM 18796 / CECT 7217 / JCM 14584 / KCTC 4019 / B3) TaxID=795797 RepID=D8JBZ2_HALJB|nr:Rieske (2Fe-2S) protein [Halalkalicoccus jeotgali]ADJ16899.1 Rieske (2Fe-2S) iron-sulfur domain protein [Halalkalicoccus jeotgali B3]ELY38664.1 Rieske (2Fe-2S) iron-sulfur domain protein [Halalkalicoccus jeotgali B3]